jgi:hypothetical protein
MGKDAKEEGKGSRNKYRREVISRGSNRIYEGQSVNRSIEAKLL